MGNLNVDKGFWEVKDIGVSVVPKLSGPSTLTIMVKVLRIPGSSQAWCHMSLIPAFRETEAGESLQVWGQRHLLSKSQDSQGYKERPVLEKEKKERKRERKKERKRERKKGRKPNKKESQVLRATVRHGNKTLSGLECLLYAVGDWTRSLTCVPAGQVLSPVHYQWVLSPSAFSVCLGFCVGQIDLELLTHQPPKGSLAGFQHFYVQGVCVCVCLCV